VALTVLRSQEQTRLRGGGKEGMLPVEVGERSDEWEAMTGGGGPRFHERNLYVM